MATTTLTLTNGSVTITGGGLIATGGGTSSAGSADSFRVGSSQKLYFEFTYNVRVSGNTGAGFGFVGAAYSNFAVQMVLLYSAGGIYEDGSNTGVNIGATVNGDVICYAVNFLRGLYWVRKNAGNWNGIAGADPVTGAGGRAIPASMGFIAPITNFGQSADQITANFGATAFAQAVPAGYTSGWASPADPSTVLTTQVGAEVFILPDATPTSLVVTHLGAEVWRSTADSFPSALLVSTVNIEVFVSSANRRPGNAALLIGL
jgi:hypothetical protein